jgi:hypothetical protein
MDIKWSSLGEVAVVSLGVAVGVVVIFAIGVLAWSLRPVPGDERNDAGPSSALMTTAAGFCFFACALIVCYGIYLMVPQFH